MLLTLDAATAKGKLEALMLLQNPMQALAAATIRGLITLSCIFPTKQR